MVYDPNIPQTGDNLSKSQGQILGNFTALNTIFNFDHYAWNDSTTANQGLHRKVAFPATNTVGAQSGLASVIYAKNVSSVASPYFDNAAGSSVLWRGGSGNGLPTTSFGGNQSSGYMKFPNGFIVQWGNNTQVKGDTISFPLTFPNACFEVIPCILRSAVLANATVLVYVSSMTASGWVVNTPSGTVGISWIAVGN